MENQGCLVMQIRSLSGEKNLSLGLALLLIQMTLLVMEVSSIPFLYKRGNLYFILGR